SSRLRDRFSRLYHLDRRKEGRVGEKGRWGDNGWVWEWDWAREPTGRVYGEVEELISILQNVSISIDCRDVWRWNARDDGKFMVKTLTKMMEEKILNEENTEDETRLNRLVPKKVNIFVWRAIKGKLPVRVELDKRGIDLDTILCPCCGDIVESWTCSRTVEEITFIIFRECCGKWLRGQPGTSFGKKEIRACLKAKSQALTK
ncbi:reverse transcriptase domain, reverse transcriptase zinc-binding domain protein, partial [Tanacetum coccineum]